MEDRGKTKEQLISELVEMRRRIAELETSEAELKQMEEELRLARQDWEGVFQATEHPILVLDPQHNILAANRATMRATGLSEVELMGKKCWEVFHKTDRPPQGCPLESMLKSGHFETREMEVEALNGTFLVSCTPVLDQSGRLARVIHLATDITERKQAEEALRKSEERFRRLAEQSPDIIFRSGMKGLEYISPACIPISGFTPEEYYADPNLSPSHVHPDEQSKLADLDAQLNGGPARCELRIIHKDGHIVWTEQNLVPIFDESGKLVAVEGIVRDITERKRAEETLRETEERYRSLFEQSADAVVILDLNGVITLCNRATLEWSGYAEDKVVGKHFSEVVAVQANGASEYLKLFNAFIRGDTPVESEVLYHHKDGTTRWLQTRSTFLKVGGVKQGIQVILRDITERKQAEEELKATREFNQRIVETSPIGIHVVDRDFIVKVWNSYFEDYTTVKKESIVGKNLFEVMPGLVASGWDETYKKVIETRETFAQQGYRYVRSVGPKKGEILYQNAKIVPLKINGDVIGAITIVEDVTEHKRAEQALQESEERFRTSVENMLDCFGIYSAIRDETGRIVDFRIEYVNEAACINNRMSKEEQIGKHLLELLPMHRETGLLDEYCQVVEMGKPLMKESLLYEDVYGGQRLARAFDIRAVRLGDGFAAAWRDITERKQAEEQLKESAERLRRMLGQTVEALSSMIEQRDPYTAGHQRRVTRLACAIAEEMGLTEEQLEAIRIAGTLHDIGKINVPAQILNRPGKLSNVEMALIKTHPQSSYDIVRGIEFIWPVAQIVLQHHERLDRSGYPAGLSGKEIILEARVLAVADVVEAMSSHRPYRAALGIDKALEEISQNRGILYDAKVVDACLKLFTEKGFKLE